MSSLLFSDLTPTAGSTIGPPPSSVSSAGRHLVLYETSIRHSDPAKRSLIFSPVQNQVALSKYAHRLFGQVCVLFAQSCPTLQHQGLWPAGSSVHGILRARILSGLPLPSPGDLPDPGMKQRSPTLWADSLPSEPPDFKWTKSLMN